MPRDLSPITRPPADAVPPDVRDAVAVVVGIDRYGDEPRWDLAGPVADAARFAEWFRSVGVPEITVLASPVPSGLPDGVEVLPADRATVREVLVRRPATQTRSTLFVVWGGHGFVDVHRRRRLYYADTTPADPLDLDLDALLARFASDRVPRLDRQYWIVDACQVHGPHGPSPRVTGHETFEAGDAVPGRAQDVLFAAGFGQPALDLVAARTGVFSREVLRVLTADGVSALPDLPARLRAVFSDLRAQGRTSQTPTYLWHRTATGNEGHLLRPVGAAPAPAAPPRLTAAALLPAVEALESVPEFQSPTAREEILRLLRGRVYTAIPRQQTARLEAVSVIRTCMRFPGGLEELVEAVRFFASGDPSMDRFEAATRRLGAPP
ncbi:hypothetical protein GCM10009557_33880 [Virgisporangium ochraceum]